MSNLKGVKPGDVLLHTRENRKRGSVVEPTEVTVSKIGTKLVHIPLLESRPEGPTATYWIENGIGKDYRHGRLWRAEDWELEKERPALEDALKRHHRVEVWPDRQSVPVLRKLLAVLEGDE